MQPFLRSLKKSALSLLFPQICLHCQTALPEEVQLLCRPCFSTLLLLDLSGHCQGCFSPSVEPICSECGPFLISASCFMYEEAAKSLIRAFKFNQRPDLAQGLSSFMLLQLDRLSWPLPDLITFIPQSFLRTKFRGYNQSELLAQELGCLLSRRVVSVLKKPHFTLSQTQQKGDERLHVAQNTFEKTNQASVEQKEILLIDDVYTTGATVAAATRVLQKMGAKKVYALTFARAEF